MPPSFATAAWSTSPTPATVRTSSSCCVSFSPAGPPSPPTSRTTATPRPYGTSSRRWSHEARKRYNFQLAYTINQRYLTEQRDKLTPSQFALLERRSRQLRTLEHFHRLREAVARRDVRSTVSSVAAQPAVIAYCARQLWRRWRRVFVSATDATKATAGQLAVGSMDIASEPSQPVA